MSGTLAGRVGAVKTLVTGGVRSGKSRYAESLLTDAGAVTYIAPGRPADEGDPEWAARVAGHQLRRPAGWTTVETHDVSAALSASDQAVLVDCLGTWVTATVDEFGTWDQPLAEWQGSFDERLDALVAAWQGRIGETVAVTNEVGWGVVPDYRSGRLFTDLLGRTNQAIAAVSDRVVLVVAGRTLVL